jgi:hypothetical protein
MRRPYPLRHTLLLLAPIILACSPAAAAASLANAACHLILRADLPATVVPRFGAVVTVSINSFPAELGISTDPTATFLNQHFAESHHLPSVPVASEEALDNTPRIARDVSVNVIRLGTIEIQNVRMLVPSRHDASSTEHNQTQLSDKDWTKAVAGTLGPRFLSQFDVEFDLAAHRVRLYDHENCTGPLQPWPGVILQSGFGPAEDPNAARFGTSPNGMPIEIPALLNGQPGTVSLDSIEGANYMTRESGEHIGVTLDGPGVPPPGLLRHDASIHYYRTVLKSISIGNETINNVAATVVEGPYPHDDFLRELSLGVGFFQANHVYIAYAAKRIYFTPYSFTDARK